MKTFLILISVIILRYVIYMLFPTISINNPAGRQPHNSLTAIPFRYGEPASSYLYKPTAPDPFTSSVLPNPVKLNQQDRTHFQGILDLPKSSFAYVVQHLNQHELNRLISYGITQIRFHPNKAVRYAYRLSVCHALYTTADKESDLVLDEPAKYPARRLYEPKSTMYQSTVAGRNLVDWLPGSTIIPYRSLIDILGSLLTALYYVTTALCSLLVAGFIGYYLLHLPWQQSVSVTLSPPQSDLFDAPNPVDTI